MKPALWLRPDGDAELTASVDSFRFPACEACGGFWKPDVVFFGESVPLGRVEASRQMVDSASLLLVVGSSLTVFSGFRFVRHAHERSKPVAIFTRGATRGDPLAAVTLDAPLEDALPLLVQTLEEAPAARHL
jgi:NAD-dependent SIR2 family protein deacetylase